MGQKVSCHENRFQGSEIDDVARYQSLTRELLQVLCVPETRSEDVTLSLARGKNEENRVHRRHSTSTEAKKSRERLAPLPADVLTEVIIESDEVASSECDASERLGTEEGNAFIPENILEVGDENYIKAATTTLGHVPPKATRADSVTASTGSQSSTILSEDDAHLKATLEELERTKMAYDQLMLSFREKETLLTNVTAALDASKEQLKSRTEKRNLEFTPNNMNNGTAGNKLSTLNSSDTKVKNHKEFEEEIEKLKDALEKSQNDNKELGNTVAELKDIFQIKSQLQEENKTEEEVMSIDEAIQAPKEESSSRSYEKEQSVKVVELEKENKRANRKIFQLGSKLCELEQKYTQVVTKSYKQAADETLQQLERKLRKSQIDNEELSLKVAELEDANEQSKEEIVQLRFQLSNSPEAATESDKVSKEAFQKLEDALTTSQADNKELSLKIAELEDANERANEEVFRLDSQVRQLEKKCQDVTPVVIRDDVVNQGLSAEIVDEAVVVTPEKVYSSVSNAVLQENKSSSKKQGVKSPQERDGKILLNEHKVAKNDTAELRSQFSSLEVAFKRAEVNRLCVTNETAESFDGCEEKTSKMKLIERGKRRNLNARTNGSNANKAQGIEDTSEDKENLTASKILKDVTVLVADIEEELVSTGEEKKSVNSDVTSLISELYRQTQQYISQSQRDSEALCSLRKELERSQSYSTDLEKELTKRDAELRAAAAERDAACQKMKVMNGIVKWSPSPPLPKEKTLRLSVNMQVCVRVRPFLEGEMSSEPTSPVHLPVTSPPLKRVSCTPLRSPRSALLVKSFSSPLLQPSSTYSDPLQVSRYSSDSSETQFPFQFVNCDDDTSSDTSEKQTSFHSSLSTVSRNILVYEPRETKLCRKSIINNTPQHRRVKHSFDADHVFPPACTQVQVWSVACEAFVQKAIDGENVCLFSYGQCGSGKTYTMIGDSGGEGEGVLFRSVRKLFQAKTKIESEYGDEVVVDIYMEFVEIYNDKVNDLLCPNSLPRASQSQSNKTVCVKSEEDAKSLLEMTQQKLFQMESRKKHLIVTMTFSVVNLSDTDKSYRGRLRICVLGGTGFSANSGDNNNSISESSTPERRAENQSLAQSLNALRYVVEKLKQASSSHVPYRDSKLTYTLIDSLEGEAHTLAIICCSPQSAHVNESLASLRFASKLMTDGSANGGSKLVTMDKGVCEESKLVINGDDKDGDVRKMLSYECTDK